MKVWPDLAPGPLGENMAASAPAPVPLSVARQRVRIQRDPPPGASAGQGNGIERHGEDAKRTMWVAECACGNRREYPHTTEYVPREVWCPDCSTWTPVKELSWDGTDFAKLLPVLPRP